jgi:hypothetical protein
MNGQIQPSRGRPATRAKTIEMRKSVTVLKEATEAWAERLRDDKLTEILASENFDIKNKIYSRHSPNMPHRLILALESADPEYMTTQEIAVAFNEYKDYILWVENQRKTGQQEGEKVAQAKKRNEHLLSLPSIFSIVANLKPKGRLTPNSATAIAMKRWQLGIVTNESPPSERTLRRFFSKQQRELLATQGP